MLKTETLVAVFPDHQKAELAVKELIADGFDVKDLSLVGKGFHTDEKVVGFYNIGDRVKFWGVRGAFWGGFWGLFFGGLLITLPAVGPVAVLGYLAAVIVTTVENAALFGGLSALGAALYSIGIPRDSVLQYEGELKADAFLVMTRGAPDDIARARKLLSSIDPSRLEAHPGVEPTPTARDPVTATA